MTGACRRAPLMTRQCPRLLPLLTFFLLVILPRLTRGVCEYNGLYYQEKSKWFTKECEECRCMESIPICHETHCSDPGCDYQHNEGLKILSIDGASCCPTCSRKQPCFHNGHIKQHDDDWYEECKVCYCDDGVVQCQEETCNAIACGANNIKTVASKNSTCCPTCAPKKESCDYGGKVYQDLETWKTSDCAACVCKNGRTQCFLADCPPKQCSVKEELLFKPGYCCPKCIPLGCVDGDKVYEHGQRWKKNRCTHCKCDSGQIQCSSETCDIPTRCPSGFHVLTREGICCPECISSKAHCEFRGRTYYDGELWNISACNFCSCSAGKISCRESICQTARCLPHEKKVHIHGKCCPECAIDYDVCYHDHQSFQAGELWLSDTCELNSCESGLITKYSPECPKCAPGWRPEYHSSSCCPVCVKSNCAADCIKCMENYPSHCHLCKNQNHKLQEGKCVDSCSSGFYESGITCQKCHISCAECHGGSDRECKSCNYGLFLQNGYCSRHCSENYYETNGICYECHGGCKKCTGPGDDQCSSCKTSTEVILNGKCVADCGQKMYIDPGRLCQPCHERCVTCERHGPKCTLCSDGSLIEDGFCVSSCSIGYYKWNDRFCKACHESCSECSGPAANQCINCKDGFLKQNGLCKRSCGDGYFKDKGTCRTCHSSCLRCGGSALFECLDCMNPLESLNTFPSLNYGRCDLRCPRRRFRNDFGVCAACHKSCLSCNGPRSIDCTACQDRYFLQFGQCVSTCNVGSYPYQGLCVECHPRCKSCKNQDVCLSCHRGLELSNGTCDSSKCPAYHYVSHDGSCKECGSYCSKCILSGNNVDCVECDNKDYSPQAAECVADCQPSYFKNVYGICQRCHNSCLNCTNAGRNGCTKCPNGRFLSSDSTCLKKCPAGYQGRSGICTACRPGCRNCLPDGTCTKCNGNRKVLQLGECVEECHKQYYFDQHQQRCKECSWHCNSCDGPTSKDCISCLAPMILQNGSCVSQCNDGFYKKDNYCQECEPHCKACDESLQCTSCQSPYILHNKMCIQHCPYGTFADQAKTVCSACDEGCDHCSSYVSCHRCSSKLILLNGRCIRQCPEGYVQIQETGVCELLRAINVTLQENIYAEIGIPQPINSDILSINHKVPSALRVKFVSLPSSSRVWLRGNVNDKFLMAGSMTEFSNFENKKIVFQQDDSSVVQGHLKIQISDSYMHSNIVDVPIILISSHSPNLVVNNPLIVQDKGELTVTAENLNVQDIDNIKDVKFVIKSNPGNGTLTVSGKLDVSEFMMEDITKGLVKYTHSHGIKDLVDFIITDGTNNQVVRFIIKIVQEVHSPVIVCNSPGYLMAGGTLTIHNELLRAIDPSRTKKQLNYIFNESPEGRFKIQASDYHTPRFITQFTQEDINNLVVQFEHYGGNANSVNLPFKIQDNSVPPNSVENQVFHIFIIPQNSLPRPDVNASFSIIVSDHNPIAITPAMLKFVDDEQSPDSLEYHILKFLPSSSGYIYHLNHPTEVLKSFTQADVDAMKIMLQPIPKIKELISSFTFTVADGKNESDAHNFTITMLPFLHDAPRMSSQGVTIKFKKGGNVQIQGSWFSSDIDSVGILLIKAPKHGSLILRSNAGDRHLIAGTELSKKDLGLGNYYYLHEDSNTRNDSMQFYVSDGKNEWKPIISVEILDLKKEDSTLPDTAFLIPFVGTVSVNEGSAITLSLDDFELVKGPNSKEIVVTLISETLHGKFEKMINPNQYERLRDRSSFVGLDLEKKLIRYVSNTEIGRSAVTDLAIFDIHEKTVLLGSQELAIKILPVNNKAPDVLITSEPEVDEGKSVILDPDVIRVVDPDSSSDELLVIVDVLPSFGQLEDVTKGSDPVTSFSFKSFLHGDIQYRNTEHLKKEVVKDSMIIHVNDGVADSLPVQLNMSINLVNDESPLLITDTITVPGPGLSAVIRNTSVYTTDTDTDDEDIVLKIEKAPMYGVLKQLNYIDEPSVSGISLNEGESFSYQEILQELITYQHLQLSELSDSITLSATDGLLNSTKTINIIIQRAPTEVPKVSRNAELRIPSGSSAYITNELLYISDADSEDDALTFAVKSDVKFGKLFFDGRFVISVDGPVTSFSQRDIRDLKIKYIHDSKEPSGVTLFRFNITDPEGATLGDQSFVINVIEDVLPPVVTVNTGITVKEGASIIVTTDHISSTDYDSEPASLKYIIEKGPNEGFIGFRGKPVSEFTQSDIAAGLISYVHTSARENVNNDEFKFTVTDGVNSVRQTFLITITPVNDQIPTLVINTFRVQEGVSKVISEFELSAQDTDSKPEDIVFSVIQPPRHGVIKLVTKVRREFKEVTSFTMQDVFDNNVRYQHDGSNSLQDSFFITVGDGKNKQFMYQNAKIENPVQFKLQVIPVDDGMPVVIENKPLSFLEQAASGQAMNVITSNELKTTDDDTPSDAIKYMITKAPQYGYIEMAMSPGKSVNEFYQSDIDAGHVFYQLTDFSGAATEDSFVFDVLDSKPNIVTDNVFHVQWSFISFLSKFHYVNETSKFIRLKVRKVGNLKQYSVVLCRTKSGSAKSITGGARSEKPDFVSYTGQIQFDAWVEEKTCDVAILDDNIFEGPEVFSIELSQPTYSIITQPSIAHVNIIDYEDYPVINLEKKIYQVEETDGKVNIGIVRSGDLTQAMSVLCYTRSGSAMGSEFDRISSGSDYISRQPIGTSWVFFSQNEVRKDCEVTIIDDSFQEEEESFSIVLEIKGSTNPVTHIAEIVILGPNDEPEFNFEKEVIVASENENVLSVVVLRTGSDLSKTSSVWCNTKQHAQSEAIPDVDYIPISQQLIFQPGEKQANCDVKILDDSAQPLLEPNKTFSVHLQSPENGLIGLQRASLVIISDTDVPVLQFVNGSLRVNETQGQLSIPIVRSGDLTISCSIICYTQQQSAEVGVDFEERVRNGLSRVLFQPNQKIANCNVRIIDDFIHESEESFLVKLADAEKPTAAGFLKTTVVYIDNAEDVPTVFFEQPVYRVTEPSSFKKIKRIILRMIRSGDTTKRAKVRVSTRDGSASSGHDYHAKSRNIRFKPGERMKKFEVTIIHRESTGINKHFKVMIEKQGLVNMALGNVTSASITIIDQPESSSNVLPAPPVVISLLDYDSKKIPDTTNPSTGYPLICLTVCDSTYPHSENTVNICDELKINKTKIRYQWEAAIPSEFDNSRPSFELITDATIFGSARHKVLDSMFFTSNFRIRCVAQVINNDGLGLPLRSKEVTISNDKGICRNPVVAGFPPSVGSQKFSASLKYIGADDNKHSNHLHIHLKIPHEDGIVPIISTTPINNIHSLLTDPIYRQQHVCSNLGTFINRYNDSNYGFLPPSVDALLHPSKTWPHQFDATIRENSTLLLYKHLDLKSCTWTFDAWYHMTELIDVCRGSVISDFEVRNKGQSYLTIQVPLYVSYVQVMGPTGWSSVDHSTQLEFSFYYNTVLWRAGVKLDSSIGGQLQVLRTRVTKEGKLNIDFKTKAKFRGRYVLQHHTLPEIHSVVIPPENLNIKFSLTMLWSEQTLDGPTQLWRATSDYTLKDYSGLYKVELIPCTVTPEQSYRNTEDIICTAHNPQQFTIPISFQQISRPVPVIYSLNTEFYVTNNKNAFLAEPATGQHYDDFKGIFSKGDAVYGKVSWSPEQNLESAYKLIIDKVFLCTGKDGKIPTYDPTGKIYSEGPQYGCIQPSTALKYRFILLDRYENQDTSRAFKYKDRSFEAKFATDYADYSALIEQVGVDGFSFQVDPLFIDESGHEWFIQVLYTIGPADGERTKIRSKRTVFQQLENRNKNGTNIQYLRLEKTVADTEIQDSIIIPVVAGTLVTILVSVFAIFFGIRYRKKRSSHTIQGTELRTRAQSGISVQEVKLNSQVETSRTFRPLYKVYHNNLKDSSSSMSGTEV